MYPYQVLSAISFGAKPDHRTLESFGDNQVQRRDVFVVRPCLTLYINLSEVDTPLQELEDTFSDTDLSSLKIVVDAGAGCQAGVAFNLFKRLGTDVTALHDTADGRFPHRHPDCAIPAHLNDLVQAVRTLRADIGIAFDGDGDRLAIVDDTGQVLGAERLAMILLKGPLQLKLDAPVILDVKCSMQLERMVRAAGTVPQRCKSGHAYMKKMVITRNALMGVELSGHIFLQAISGRDDPLFTALVLCRHLAETQSVLSQLAADLPDIVMTPDIRLAFGTTSIRRIIETCSEGIDGALVETVDGVQLFWNEGWILVRRSITEPKVTIRIEGEKPFDLEQLAARFIQVFPELGVPVRSAVREALKT
jgi:phosphomannomutase/phosphoglucomutase